MSGPHAPRAAIGVRSLDCQPIARPAVESADLHPHTTPTASVAIPSFDVRLADHGLPCTAIERVAVVSVPIRSSAPKAQAYTFAERLDPFDQTGPLERPVRAKARGVSVPAEARRRTRVDVPRDVVKLVDRLYYTLQPPLETWMSGLSLDMPFAPFGYQLEGVAFLYPRYAAVLADEMGLGKTMQAITAVRLLLRSGEIGRVLLVCPKPLVANWRREFESWAPEIPLAVIEGDKTTRSWRWQRTEIPVTIANYELLLRDRATIKSAAPHYDLVILDESQRIKNRTSSTARVVQAIPRTRSWALTGTPVENSADDLVGIFEFLSPGYLSPGMKPRRMSRVVGDYILRRTKDQVLADLPPKLFRDADLELGPQQRETYRLAEDEGVLRLEHMGQAATIQHVFELVLRLKQICNFDPATGESTKLERLQADLEEVAASGQKAIVFSQWVESLRTLARRLERFGPLEYHGQISPRRREGILERFREDRHRHVLLMSYGAGGVGLNLQFCSYVFLFDRWWNPAVEDQAINRAHRIGAAGPVTISRFLTLGTIEERIDQVLQQKREIFDAIFSGTSRPGQLGLSRDEIFGLFQLRSPAGPIEVAA